MDAAITSLRLLTGLALVIVSFGVFLPYSIRPEEFFIKRLRPTSGHKITHRQLLARAFIGAGLLYPGAWMLSYLLIVRNVTGMSLRDQITVWLIVTLVAGPIMGSLVYLHLRLRRYRRLIPDEPVNLEAGFVLRKP